MLPVGGKGCLNMWLKISHLSRHVFFSKRGIHMLDRTDDQETENEFNTWCATLLDEKMGDHKMNILRSAENTQILR